MITAILAQSRDMVIGTEGPAGPQLPWRLPPDLRRFKRLTDGHAIIMGRTTFVSIGRVLPNRRSVVLTSRPLEVTAGDVAGFRAVDEALAYALEHDPDPFVIGGARVFEAVWPRIDRVELTEVDAVVGLGVVFEWDRARFREAVREPRAEHDGLGYSFVTLEKATQRRGEDR